MKMKTQEIVRNDIVEWLEQKFKDKKLYKELEESPEFQKDLNNAQMEQKFFWYPRLPIDLISVEKRREFTELAQKEGTSKKKKTRLVNNYTLFFVISSRKTLRRKNLNYFEKRLSFYLYYFSRISEPQRFRINVIISKSINLPREFIQFCAESGLGLWTIDLTDRTRKRKRKEICKPKTLRERMICDFGNAVDNPAEVGEAIGKICRGIGIKDASSFRKAIKESAGDFTILFEKYILEAADAIAGVTDVEFGRRYLDRELLYQTCRLNKVSYRAKLIELVTQHLDENYDDYEFVSEVFKILWRECFGIPYVKFLETFEPALLHIFAEGERDKIYRDHYIHQFQVFLLGLYIIDKCYESFAKKYKRPELCWLVTASFHDMAYPIQLYDDWTDEFFNKVFKVKNLGHVELKTNFVDKSFLRAFSYLIVRLCEVIKGKKPSVNWVANENELLQCFYEEITGPKKKNHSVLSSLCLLKLIQEKFAQTVKIKGMQYKEAFDYIFVPSALAIALHDKDMWEKLRNEEKWKGRVDKCPLPVLEFELDPLSFILIFCDSIQEWGRPTKSKIANKEKERLNRFYLKSTKYEPDKGFDITIHTPNRRREEEFFKNKEKELRNLQTFLKQPSNIEFTIHLEDKDGKGVKEGFRMLGACG